MPDAPMSERVVDVLTASRNVSDRAPFNDRCDERAAP